MPARARHRREAEETPPVPDGPEWVLAGRAYVGGRIQPLEIGISAEGKIVALGRDLRAPRRHEVADRLILPAATDLHVHFRSPVGLRSGESWSTGTVQAALGGVGLVAEMPNSDPPVTTADRLLERRDAGAGRLAVDMLLFGALTERRRVPALARACGAFKLYLAPTTGIGPPDAAEPLDGLLEAVAATGLPLTVHAEDPREFRHPAELTSTAGWNEARPLRAERRAVEELLARAPPGLRLNIAHVTQAEVAELLARAGHLFEVTPHHLLLSARSTGDAFSKVNPPLRREPERSALFERFAAGSVPVLASDHAPHPIAEKELPFERAPSGMPGVATMLPLLLALARTGALPLPELIRSACERPARWLGQPAGRIALGHRADLIGIDPKQRRTISAEGLGIPCGWTAFEGWEGVFPQEHYHGGEPLVEGGEYVGRPLGRFVRPEFAPAPRGPAPPGGPGDAGVGPTED